MTLRNLLGSIARVHMLFLIILEIVLFEIISN